MYLVYKGEGENMEKISLQAMAKINLGLDVLRRRENGYHDVKMIMQTVGLYDTLTFMRKSEPGIVITTDDINLPAGEDNLIYKAVDMMIKRYDIREGVSVRLEKRIPIAAGMAGGSTDAAAAFVGMNLLFDLKQDVETLKKMAVTLGADIPYCIQGGTALSEGIGELLTPLKTPPACSVVIIKPDLSVSTKFVYENLKLDGLKHPDIDTMMEALKEEDLERMCKEMGNVLETVTIKEYPVIEEIKGMLKEAGAVNSLMSGSGPTIFGIFTDVGEAQKAAQMVEVSFPGCRSFITEFVDKAQVVVG